MQFHFAPPKLARVLRFLLLFCLFLAGCGSQGGPSAAPGESPSTARRLSWQRMAAFPHDSGAFTQGLLWHNGKLIESTGLVGQSSLRRVTLETGQVTQKVDIPAPIFAEGISLADGKLFLLSWQNRTGYTFDPANFQQLGQFSYQNEGWGLTFDGQNLIQSDGTDTLTFRNPNGFTALKTVRVTRNGEALSSLNELEFIDGKVWANVWTTDLIVIINPNNGRVEAELDLSALRRELNGLDSESVLNGIAYDEAGDRLFVTGKNWPKLFQIEVEDF